MPKIGVTRPLLAAAVLVVLAGPAHAQTFPPEESWVPLPCGTQVMHDPFRDQSGAVDERDIVGDLGAPAGYSASDGTYLFIRIRLDQDPAPGDALRPFAWGVGISVDGDSTTYEILLMVNGNSGRVEVYENTSTTRADDPRDPADQPAVVDYPFTSHGLVEEADGSGYGGDKDFFLGFAVPWSALQPLGLTPNTPATLWAGSSSTANTLNGDIACHDGTGDAPTLSGTGENDTILDPERDTDGDGYPDRIELQAGTDPNDSTSRPSGPVDPTAAGVDLEGGGGCKLCGAVSNLWPALLALAVLLLPRRRR